MDAEGPAASSRGRVLCGTKAAGPVVTKDDAAASGLEETALVGEHDGLCAVPQLQLLEQPGDVGLDRGVADEQLAADLGVREPAGDQSEHVHLARGQRLDRLRRRLL